MKKIISIVSMLAILMGLMTIPALAGDMGNVTKPATIAAGEFHTALNKPYGSL